ncbi:MAG: hypothetical protein GF398_07175 [Chitinivibrionales bacterium]|nr:hypothetical protein [Chitinivibrionales bacterium]
MHARHFVIAGIIISALAIPLRAQEDQKDPGFRIDEPGTITFTVGVKIEGKVEKPQVVIFLPKEEPFYRSIGFSHSFKQDILTSVPFKPVDPRIRE